MKGIQILSAALTLMLTGCALPMEQYNNGLKEKTYGGKEAQEAKGHIHEGDAFYTTTKKEKARSGFHCHFLSGTPHKICFPNKRTKRAASKRK